jgi:ribonuclease P protein component
VLWRIRDRRTFLALRADGVRRRSGPVSVTALLSADGTPPRVALAVGKRTGPSVVRNRLRRQLRAIVAELDPPSGAYLLAAGPAAVGLPHAELRAHVAAALDAVVAAA